MSKNNTCSVEKNSYDRQFVRCDVDKNKKTPKLETQHKNTLHTNSLWHIYQKPKKKQNQTKNPFIVCLLDVYFPFPVQMKPPKVTLLTFHVPPLGLKGVREKKGINIPKQNQQQKFNEPAQIILFKFTATRRHSHTTHKQ